MYVSRGTTTTCYYSNWEPHHTLTSPALPSHPFGIQTNMCCIMQQNCDSVVCVTKYWGERFLYTSPPFLYILF